MIGSGRFLKRFQMAADALRREPLTIKLPYGTRFVARIAVHRRVCADQGKPILMLVDGLDQNLPATYSMAGVALRPIPSPVNVGVTVLAIATCIREHGVDVTFLTAHTRVQSAQWVTGLVVIEIRLSADRSPCGRSVTTLARNLHRTMWTVNGGRARGLLRRRKSGQLQQQERSDQEGLHQPHFPARCLLPLLLLTFIQSHDKKLSVHRGLGSFQGAGFVAGRTLLRSGLIKEHLLSADQPRQFVAAAAARSAMRTLQCECGSFVVVKK
jgi:hypothetical protein